MNNNQEEYKIHVYRKRPIRVTAHQTNKELDLVIENNNTLHASVGDFIVQTPNGLPYPCKPDIFYNTYTHIQGDQYEKLQVIIHAYKTDHDEVIDTLEGPASTHMGDFIIIGINGEMYPVPEDIFLDAYDRVD